MAAARKVQLVNTQSASMQQGVAGLPLLDMLVEGMRWQWSGGWLMSIVNYGKDIYVRAMSIGAKVHQWS